MGSTKVTIRQRGISKGRYSLYLDFYPAIRIPETMQMSRREYLGIYIYEKPRTEIEKEYYREMLTKAEAIRAIRVQSIINENFGFLDKNKRNADFLDYFYQISTRKDPKWSMVYAHFEKFVKGKCSFGDVTVDLCRKFRAYLLFTDQLKSKKLKVSQNSAAGYFSTFRSLLKIAYRDKLINENINDFWESIGIKDT